MGDYKKTEVRKIAEEKGLVNARKPDSQDICFVDTGNYVDFIKKYRNIEIPEGTYIDKEGNIIGKNKGMIHYTIGQRKGLGMSFPERKYVIDKDSKTNTVTLGSRQDALVSSLIAREMNYILYERPEKEIKVHAKIRYSQKEASAKVIPMDDSKVEIALKHHSLCAPVISVLYLDDMVVEAAFITKTELMKIKTKYSYRNI